MEKKGSVEKREKGEVWKIGVSVEKRWCGEGGEKEESGKQGCLENRGL